MGKVRGVHTLSVVEKNWGTKTSFDTLVAEGGSCAGGKKETKAYITQLGVRGETVKKNIDPEKVRMGGRIACVKGGKTEEDRIELLESSIRDLVVLLRRSESREEEFKQIIRQHSLCDKREMPQGRRRRLMNCGPGRARLGVLREGVRE